jgi:DNA-binding HxlR family transcriptional regulator
VLPHATVAPHDTHPSPDATVAPHGTRRSPDATVAPHGTRRSPDATVAPHGSPADGERWPLGRFRGIDSKDDTITSVASLVGDRWSVLVVRDVFRGVRRFEELHDDLGVSRAVLSSRLRKLTAAGVLTKAQYQDRPARYEYRLTPMGVELSPVLVALLHWGDRWLGEGDPTAVLVHAPCDTEFEQAFWCPTCRTTFGPTAVRARPSR